MRIGILVLIAVLVGCAPAPRHRVIIDTKNVDLNRYYQDLDECSGYAEQVDASGNTARGAGRGAAVGGAVGGILRGTEGAAKGAGVGAVTGAARGYESSEKEQVKVVKNCMRGRGYRVLN